MARKARTPEELTQDAPLNETALETIREQQAERMQVVLAQFGDSLPFDRERYINEARFYMQQSAAAMLEAGRRLVVLKEDAPHGDFIHIVESRLNLNYRAAARMMQAAVKFTGPALANVSTSTHLIEAANSKSKLFELMTLDTDDLKELAEGGTVANLTLDDVERMTVSELRAALREERENYQAQGGLVAKRDAKIAELQTEVRKAKKRVAETPPDEVAKELLQEVSRLAFTAEAAIRGDFYQGIRQLEEHHNSVGTESPAVAIAGFLIQIETALNEIYSEFNIPRKVSSKANPYIGFEA